jgi:hypothetical protein
MTKQTGRVVVKRVVTVAVAASVALGLMASPSFADIHTGSRSCPSGRTVVTHSYGYGSSYHNATLAGVLKTKNWTGSLNTQYHNYFYTGWQNVDSWAVQTAGGMSQWSADCVS